VHSSTSSFRPLPRGWFSLVGSGLLAIVLLTGWELFWRSREFVPTLTDSEALWCHTRKLMAHDEIVIVGSSRLQTGLDPAIMSRALNRHVTQLAINGANPGPLLRDLADDESFAGTVLLEYMPLRILTADSQSVMRAHGFVAACRATTFVSDIDSTMSRALERRVALMNPELNAIAIMSYTSRHHRLPRGVYARLRDDRFLALTFREGHLEGINQPVWESDNNPNALSQRLAELHAAIVRIQARGGRVILYRPPVSGAALADEEAHFPTTVWLPRVADSLGVPVIDFAEVPELRDMRCPDGGHLEAAAVPKATELLAHQLQRYL
jgi:hypothetical protein